MPYLQMPDGRYFKYADDVSFDDAAEMSRKQFPKAWGEEVGGIKGAAGRGLESLISSGRTAYNALTGSAEEAAQAGLQRQKGMGEKYKEEVGLDLLKKRYEEEGLLGGAQEVLRQAPLALAEQSPNLAAALASGRVGAMVGAATPIPGGALIGGLLGAAAPSLIQQFGGNLERQAAEGVPIDAGSAFGASIPQAGLDVAGNLLPFGRTLIGKALGPKVAEALKKGATEGAEKLAQESLKKSLAKGLGVGALAEIPTEVTQQMLERAQAGLSLTSDDALAEYADTAYQVGLLAPIGSAGRLVDRSAARQDIAAKKAEEQRVAAEQARAEQIADPAYGIGLAQQRLDLQDQLAALNAEQKEVGKQATAEQKEAFKARRSEINEQLRGVDEEIDAHPEKENIARHAQYIQQQRAAEAAGAPTQLEFPGMYLAPAAEAEQAAPEITPLAEAQMRAPEVLNMLNGVVEKLNAAVASGDTSTANALMPKYRELVDYYNRLEGVIKNAPQAADLEKKLKDQVRAYRKAVDPNVGDVAAAEKALAKIQELQQQLASVKAEQDMFTAEGAVSPEILRQNEAAAQKQALAEQYGQQQQDLFAQTEGEALGQPYVAQPDQEQLLSNLLAQQGQPELTPEGLPKPEAATFMDASTRAGQLIPVYTIDPVTGKQVLRSTVRQEAPAGAYQQAKQAEEIGPQPSAEKPRPRTQAEIRAANREAARISGEELESEERTEALMKKLAEQQPEGKGDFANLLPTMRGTGAKFDPTEFFTPEAAKILKPKFDELAKLSSERDLLPKDYVDFATKSDKYVESALNGFNKVLNELGETDWSKVPGQERAARYQDAYAKSRGIIEALLRSVEASRLANGNAGLTNRQAFEMSTKLREMFDYALENRSARPDFRKNIAKLKVAYKKPSTKVLKGAERPEKQAPRFRLEAQEAEEKAPREERIVEMERLDRMIRDLKNEMYDAQKAGDKAAVAAVGKQLAAVAQQRKTLGAPEKDITAAKRKVAGLQKLLSAAEFAATEKGKQTTPTVERTKVKLEEAQAELDKIMAAPEPEAAPEEKLPHPKQKGHQFKLFKDDAKYLGRQLAALKKREQERDREIGELLRVAEAKRQKDINDAITELEAAYNEDKATYDEALAHAVGVMTEIMEHKYISKAAQGMDEAMRAAGRAEAARDKLRRTILAKHRIENPDVVSFVRALGGRTAVSKRVGPKYTLTPAQNKELKQRLALAQEIRDNAFEALQRYLRLPENRKLGLTQAETAKRMNSLVAYSTGRDVSAQIERELRQAGLRGDMAYSNVLGITEEQALSFTFTPEEKAVLAEADALVKAADEAMVVAAEKMEAAEQKAALADRKRQIIDRRQFKKMRANLAAIQNKIDAATESLTLANPDKVRLRKENEERRKETSIALAKAQEAADAALKSERAATQKRLELLRNSRMRGRLKVETSDKNKTIRNLDYGQFISRETKETIKAMDKAARDEAASEAIVEGLQLKAKKSQAEQEKGKKLKVTPLELAKTYLAMQRTYENFADAMPDKFREDLETAIKEYRGILSTYNVDTMAFIDAGSAYRKSTEGLRTAKQREVTEADMTRATLERMLDENMGRITGNKAVKGVSNMLEMFRDGDTFAKVRARFKAMQGERTAVSDSEFTKYAFERPQPKETTLTKKEREAAPPDFEAFGSENFSDLLPENDRFDFSEQTISGVNFAEGKTSMNTRNGMKGAILGYFQNPAEFDKHVTIFQNIDEAKKDATGAKALSQATNPYRVQAFTDAKGHVYMIADAVVPGQELAVFLHEVGVHAGMERLIGAENMAILSSQINQWSKLGENTLEGSIARKAVERAEKSSSANKTEERIAYFVEEAVKAGVDPIAVQKTGSPFAQWFRTLIAAMKSALRKIGLARFEDLTAQNIVDLAYGAAKLKMTGRWHGTAADFRRFNHAFMSTGEGAQAFGWGTYLAERVGIATDYWKQDVKRKSRSYVSTSFRGESIEDVILGALGKEGLYDGGTQTIVYEHFAPLFRPAFTELTKAAQMNGVAKAFDGVISDLESGLKDFLANNPKSLAGDIIDFTDSTKAVMKELRSEILASPDSFVSTHHNPTPPKGSLMYIDTAIHDDEYMDNNLELRDQPHVLSLLKKGLPANLRKAVETLKGDKLEDLTGRDVYSSLETIAEENVQQQPDKFVSLALDNIGIKGLKFFDNISRRTQALPRAHLEKQIAQIEQGIKKFGEEWARTTPALGVRTPVKPGGVPVKVPTMADKLQDLRARLAERDKPTRNYVVFNDKNIVRVMSEMGAKQEEIKFSESVVDRMLKPSTGKFNSSFDAKYPGLSSFGDRLVSKDKGVVERVAANAMGMRFAIQFVDRFAGLQKIALDMKDKLAGFQMMYWLRIFDQRNNLTAEAASVGVPVVRSEVRADGKKEYTLGRSEDSSNLREIVQEVGKAMPEIGDANATMRLFSLYLMARRIKRLNREGKDGIAVAMGRNLTTAERAEAKKQFDSALEFGENNAHFKAASEMYTRYNRALINFLAQSGAISKAQAAILNKGGDYVGFYREKNGLIVDGEHNITMGDLTTQPYLKELLGGDTAIVDFRTSSLQNTNLIISMALNNLASRNTAITMTQLGLAKSRSTKGPAADNVVRYKVDGQDWHMVVDPKETEGKYGIPADLLVKGMRGVSTTLPAIVRLMQGPANLLRKGVTRMPTYAARQVIRDSLNAYIAGGVDGAPVMNTLKEIKDLMSGDSEVGKRIHEQGIGGGQVFSGAPDDVKRLMTDIMQGTQSWATTMAWLDKLAVNADTATRVAAYKSFRAQGMSDMEASLAALEMTNFSKRGVSPSMAHMATMIPFFNAQIQGLNALWQALTKTGVASERLDLKNKLLKRGALMMAMTFAYAAMMSDDEGYQNEDADIKLSNWLFDLPGVGRVRIPIPFEVGFVFKAIPEAMVMAASKDGADRDVVDALAKMAIGSIPGGSSFFIPQAAKPALEVLTGKNLFDFSVTEFKAGDIESARLKQVEAGQRTTPFTTGVAAALGAFLNVSPVKIDHLIRGYGGGMGAFLASAVGTIPEFVGEAKAPAPEKRINEIQLIGGLFSATDGRGLIDRAYNKMEDIIEAKQTWKKLVDEGRTKEADEYATRKATMINASSLAGSFRQKMGDLASEKRAIIAAKGMTPAQKRAAIDEIRQKEIYLAKQLNSI